jgi:hypothetical protein
MAQIVILQTVNPPSPAPETVAPLDFSKLFSDYTQGVQFGQQQQVRNAFAGGIPTTDGTPNGPTDYGAVFRKFMQVGDYDDANKAMQTGIQMRGCKIPTPRIRRSGEMALLPLRAQPQPLRSTTTRRVLTFKQIAPPKLAASIRQLIIQITGLRGLRLMALLDLCRPRGPDW